MKSLYKFFIAAGVAASMGLASCVGDLDVTPTDPNLITPDSFAKDPAGSLDRLIAECYQAMSTSGVDGGNSAIISGYNGGMGTFQRAVFCLNELTTDTYMWCWPNDEGAAYNALNVDNFPSTNVIFYGTYSRLYVIISICNEFIKNVEQGVLPISDELRPRAEEYVRQARIIRGLSYFYLVDLFGNVGWSDESLPALATPPQKTRSEIFDLVVADLESVSAAYGTAYAVPAYGYVGKEACDALLAKFYLNSEVFTGVPRYQECWNKCSSIIAAHLGGGFDGSGLAPIYKTLFGANNDLHALGGARENEIIWITPQDGTYLTSYGGSTFMISAGTKAGVNNSLNLGRAWASMRSRQEFAELFSWTESGDALVSADKRTELWNAGGSFKLANTEVGEFTDGYSNNKYSNWIYNADGSIDQEASSPLASNEFSNADVPVIRLAEIYLSAAEAYVLSNGAAGNADDALTYFNYVRERAGVTPVTVGALTETNILDERARELYGENCRRTDLVRHHKFAGEGARTWSWKGGSVEGGVIPAHFDLFPIPQTIVDVMKYQQNPGY